MIDVKYKNESFKIIGACLEVLKKLVSGFLEAMVWNINEWFCNSW